MKLTQGFADNGNESFIDKMEDAEGLPLGEWPVRPQENSGCLSLTNYSTSAVFEEVHIVILPTNDPGEAPANLRFGGWNATPAASDHVAVLRDWQARFGAVPVLLSLTGGTSDGLRQARGVPRACPIKPQAFTSTTTRPFT